ncbi:MAG: hypothetical protein K8T10_20565 [Candidatus Eremiobacteraeota bacterium]|nr:hypothetical protein [Candidatus Eremiobacteraeota bacterium]
MMAAPNYAKIFEFIRDLSRSEWETIGEIRRMNDGDWETIRIILDPEISDEFKLRVIQGKKEMEEGKTLSMEEVYRELGS